MTRPRLVHLTTTDVSLDWLLGPQLSAFAEAGYEVVGMSAPGPHVAALEARGVRHVPLPALTRSVDPLADARAWQQLRRAFLRERPTILHTHNPKPGILGRLLGHRSGVPCVVNTIHGLYAQPDDRARRKLPVYAVEAAALRTSDAELVQNIEDLPVLERLGAKPGQLVHLGNGIDLDRFRNDRATRANAIRLRRQLGIDPEAFVVGMVGRLVWEKGYAEFFGAIADLRRTGWGDIEFVVVGPSDPSKAGAVDRATIDRQRAQGVHVLEGRSDLENVYPAFDVLALPSYREGFPRAAMEASAMGTPVVATNIRGCRQVVDDGVTGRLVPVRSTRPLAGAIAELASSDVVRSAMGAAARRRASLYFDQRSVIDTTLAVYERLLGERGIDLERSRPDTSRRYVDSISLVDAAASNEFEVASAA